MTVCFQMVPFLQPAHSLSLFRAIQPPADPSTPHPYLRLQRGNPKEEIFPSSLQQRFGDVLSGRNLSLPREGITIQGYCIYNPGQLQLVTAFLHVADRAKPQCFLCWITDSPQTRTSTLLLKIA